MNQSFIVTKQANGVYRWTATSSNNALDRDHEIVSNMALEMDVHRTKQYGDGSELRLFHIPYAIGGAPDFRGVHHGHLIETGEFHDTPVAKSIAEYIMANPQRADGAGWGTSIGFYGSPNEDGVFEVIIVKERSVLPLSKAANPYTAFQIKERNEMALSKSQREFLDELIANPDTQAAARTILAAADQSKALDEQGVQRKSAQEKASANMAVPPAKGPVDAGNITGDVAEVDDPGDAESKDEQLGADKDKTGKKKPKSPEQSADEAGTDPTEDEATDNAPKKMVTDLSYDDLAEAIDSHVKSAIASADPLMIMVNVIKEQNETIGALHERLKALEMQEERIKEHHETPRMLLGSLLASRSKATEVKEDDPLVTGALGALETENESFMAALGFKPIGAE